MYEHVYKQGHKQEVKQVHLKIVDGKHKLWEAWELEEKEATGLEHLTGVAKSIIWEEDKKEKEIRNGNTRVLKHRISIKQEEQDRDKNRLAKKRGAKRSLSGQR